jgi:hypothetical protein
MRPAKRDSRTPNYRDPNSSTIVQHIRLRANLLVLCSLITLHESRGGFARCNRRIECENPHMDHFHSRE